MSNYIQRQFSRNSFLYLLFPIIFTIGFILGTLYTPILKDATPIRADYTVGNVLQENIIYLIVVILSSPENFERRQVIRNTWLRMRGNISVSHYFALSAGSLNPQTLISLKEEHSIHADLLFLYSFSDSYLRLSEKLREVFRYLDKNVQYRFLLKVDDDSFVRLNALSDALQSLPQRKLYWGFFDGQASIKSKGKWKETKWILCDRYLPYAKGGGYVVSQDLVHWITLVSDHLFLYQNEDVSLGTWLAPYAIHRQHDPRFDTEFRSRGCLNTYLVTHKQTPAMMLQKYKNLMETGNLCPLEHTLRNAYVYNWNVPPSQCCVRSKNVP